MSCLFRQLFKREKLGPPVAFTKGVNIVDVTHDLTRGGYEIRMAEALQEVLSPEPPMHVSHAGFDESAKLELAAAFGDLDGADLAGPVVDVLEKVAVNGAKVGKIEAATRGAFLNTLNHHPPLDFLKQPHVANIETIS